MTWISKDSDKSRSFNFVAPAGAVNEKNEVLFPFSEKLTPVHAATHAVNITQFITFLQPGTATANITINLTPNPQLTPGAKLYLRVAASGANRTVTFGTGFATLAAVTVNDGTTKYMSFVFDGTNFIPDTL